MASNSAAASCVTNQEIHQFYAVDRKVYTILAIILRRDPVESMKVMSLWLWLEKLGFLNVVKRMLALPLVLINDLADETVTCLNVINGTHFSYSSQGYDIPLLQAFMARKISVYFFCEHRYVAARGMAQVGRDVCLEALCDIMVRAIETNTAYQNSRAADQKQGIPPSPRNIRRQPRPVRRNDVPPQDRTMFVTFSKGYPVEEHEVIHFFTRKYGDCIESLQMQEVQPFEQSLYGKIVFDSATTIDAILNGMSKAKFTIKGKHVWVRKFEARRTR